MSRQVHVALFAMLSAAGSLALAQEGRIALRLVNAGRRVIREVYVSPSHSPSWGPNLLARKARAGDEPSGSARKDVGSTAPPALTAGQRSDVALSGECGRFDVRLVAENGAEFLEDGLELCADDNVLTITDDTLTLRKVGQR